MGGADWLGYRRAWLRGSSCRQALSPALGPGGRRPVCRTILPGEKSHTDSFLLHPLLHWQHTHTHMRAHTCTQTCTRKCTI